MAHTDFDVGAGDCALLGGALDGLDRAVAVAELVYQLVDLSLRHVDLVARRTQRLIVAKLYDRLKGYRRGEDEGLVAYELDCRLRNGRDFFLFEDFGVDLGDQLVHCLVPQAVAAKLLLDQGPWRFAGPEARNLDAGAPASCRPTRSPGYDDLRRLRSEA